MKFLKNLLKEQPNPQTVLNIFNNTLSVTDQPSKQKTQKEVSDKSY